MSSLDCGLVWINECVLFTPTSEWRAVPEGAICPGGLEFKLDFSTGQNFARLPPAADPARQAASTAAAAAAAAELLPQIAIGYDDLHAQFGDALLPYTRTSVSARPDARSLADLFL